MGLFRRARRALRKTRPQNSLEEMHLRVERAKNGIIVLQVQFSEDQRELILALPPASAKALLDRLLDAMTQEDNK